MSEEIRKSWKLKLTSSFESLTKLFKKSQWKRIPSKGLNDSESENHYLLQENKENDCLFMEKLKFYEERSENESDKQENKDKNRQSFISFKEKLVDDEIPLLQI